MLKVEKFQHYLLFSVLPFLNLIISQFLMRINGPFYSGPNFDPAYVYLFNAINIAHRVTPGHYDHPGTPVQVFGAIIGLIRYLFRILLKRADTFYLDVLRNPEAYLSWLNLVTNMLLFLTLLVAGLVIYRLSKNKWMVILFQISPFLYNTTLQSTRQFNPEPFLLIVVLWLSVVIYSYTKIYARTEKNNLYAVVVGILIGLGIAIKVTFLPLVLFVVFFAEIKKIAVSLLSAFGAFVVFTLPIASKYIKFVEWLQNLLTHSGIYGGGELGLPDSDQLFANAQQIFLSEPVFFIIMFFSIAFNIWIVFKRKSFPSMKRWIPLLSIINCVFVAQTAMTIKHPPIHYMIASLGLTSLWFFVLSELSGSPYLLKKWSLLNPIIFLWILFSILVTVQSGIKDWKKSEQYISEHQQSTQIILNEFANCHVADYYRSSTIGYALSFGNDFVEDRFSDPLQQIFPNTLVYEKWEMNFHRFGDVLSKEELEKIITDSCLLLRGSPMVWENEDTQSMVVYPVHVGKFEAIYIVDRFGSNN